MWRLVPLFLLAACAQTQPTVIKVPVEVQVPVPVPCKVEQLQEPHVTDNKEAVTLNDRDLVLLLAEEREALIAYARKAAAVIRACQ
jgi:hypothetical protein